MSAKKIQIIKFAITKFSAALTLLILIFLIGCSSDGTSGLDNPFNGKTSKKIQNLIDEAKALGMDIQNIEISNPWGHVQGKPLCTYEFDVVIDKHNSYKFKVEEYINKQEMLDALEEAAGSGILVYALPEGSLFHKQDCSYVKNNENAIELTVDEAIGNNLSACQKCKPIANNIYDQNNYLVMYLPTSDSKIKSIIIMFYELMGQVYIDNDYGNNDYNPNPTPTPSLSKRAKRLLV